ncbi:MAG: glycine--tRNA ligase [Limisphaerales bacterium]
MAEPKTNDLMEKIVSLCKRRGFIFQSSEIYGGINGFWDYGPLGAELKRNVKESWWRSMTRQREDVVGLDATIIMHPKIWEASGHTTTFADPMVDCLGCKKRFRADQIEPASGVVYHYDGAKDFSAFEGLLGKLPLEGRHEAFEQLQRIWTNETEVEPELDAFLKKYLPAGESPTAVLNLFYRSSVKVCDEPFSVLVLSEKNLDRAKKLARHFYQQRGLPNPTSNGERSEAVENSTAYCNECGSRLTPPRAFNLMFKTYVGPVEDAENTAYLRPETAQAIFAQFKTVFEVARQKVPFGISQIGKAFRNEINPRNFTFRSREFEQMELEFFIRPDEAVEAICGQVATAAELGNLEHPTSNAQPPGDHPPSSILHPQSHWGWEAWHKYWVEERIRFYESIGLSRQTLVEYWQKPEELAHYARATVDILYKFPFSKRDVNGELTGEELEGIAARSDFDLSQHQRFSGKSMAVFDDELKTAWAKLDEAKKAGLSQRYFEARRKYLVKAGEPEEKADRQAREDAGNLGKGSYVPHVIEPSAGVDRLVLALICNAYSEDQAPDEKGKLETRVVMRFHPRIAPIKVAIFPLLKNRPELVAKAKEVRDLLRLHLAVFYDEAGAIGRRYRRQDEAGTPFGVTIDFDTLGEKGPEWKDTVTLRDRDTMKQDRVKIADLLPLLLDKIR